MKNKIILILFAILSFGLIFNLAYVKADSGFDVSYDGGGSSDSSYNSYSSDYSSSSGVELTGAWKVVYYCIIGIIIACIVIAALYFYFTCWNRVFKYYFTEKSTRIIIDIIKATVTIVIAMFTCGIGLIIDLILLSILYKEYAVNRININNLNHLSDDRIIKYLPNYKKEEFNSQVFNLYKEIQEAWMNFDYDKLRSNLSDELYNQYIMQLDTMKLKGEQNIMSDFRCLGVNINRIKKENENIVIKVNMIAQFKDYIVQNGKVVRGNKNKKVNVYYEITFIMSNNNIDVCPNCSSKLNNDASQVCPYCNSTINRIGAKLVMSKKMNRKQW